MESARFVVPPALFVEHTPRRSFIGPAVVDMPDDTLLMAAPWGRPPTDFAAVERDDPCPKLYRSRDGGRTWQAEGSLPAAWQVGGAASDGGCTLRWLRDGRLALLIHRHVPGLHGGGLPAITFSSDQGRSWSPVKLIGERDEVWYVMNDRLIELSTGRLLVPVAGADPGRPHPYEGTYNAAKVFYSNDGGNSWQQGSWACSLFPDERGMAEPCVLELQDVRVLMLARGGNGWLMQALSSDAGETWSVPQRTKLPSPCSSLALRRMPDGRLVVLYNHAAPFEPGAFFPRNPLVYAVSDDEAGSWSVPRVIDSTGNVWTQPGVPPHQAGQQHIYPAVCFTDEGMVVVYSSHYASPLPSFDRPADAWTVGGGKTCVISMAPDANPSDEFPM